MKLSWKVDWDIEHGFSMFVWKDQVIGINLETLTDILSPDVWNSSLMTDLELEYQGLVRESMRSDS